LGSCSISVRRSFQCKTKQASVPYQAHTDTRQSSTHTTRELGLRANTNNPFILVGTVLYPSRFTENFTSVYQANATKAYQFHGVNEKESRRANSVSRKYIKQGFHVWRAKLALTELDVKYSRPETHLSLGPNPMVLNYPIS
jgi:hypothetical protein